MCLIIQQMLMQVLSLTPDQINGLPPSEREAIQNLVCLTLVIFGHPYSCGLRLKRNQFLGGISA